MSSAPYRIDLEFEYDGERRARVVGESVAREVGEIDDERSRTRIDRDGETLLLAIEAADHVSLRAAINTWCSLVDVAEQVDDAANGSFA